MNKLKYLLGALVAVSFAACSDEPTVNGAPGEDETPVTDVAYMTINLKDVNEGGRATSGDNSFEYGTGDENKVYNAKFLFFDENKNFLLEANVWNGGSANDAKPDANVEYFGENVLVLENLKKTGYPKYLITVLNAPEKLKPIVGTTTMDDVRNLLCGVCYDTEVNGEAHKKFVMSTSSYRRVDNNNPYYATTLTSANFKVEPYPAANESPVTIYVERLAVKVRVNAALSNEKKTFTIDGKEVVGYRVPVSISGNVNDEGKPIEGVSDVYVSLDGWGLSNYEPESYISKNYDLLFGTQIGDWYWNDPQRFRGYWAASPMYGQAEPELVRNTYVGLTGNIGESLYMPETTNTYANVQNNGLLNAKNVASVILKTTVYDANGKSLNLILFQGVYYIRESFVAYALQTLDYQEKLNYYTREVAASQDENVQDGYHYTQIGTDDVEVVERDVEATGRIELISILADDTELYAKGADGKFSKIENGLEKLNQALVDFTKDSQARASTDGSQIYNIPIEHFAVAKPSLTNVGQEGEYGTVRNHIYDVTVTSISKLGGGIFRPGDGDEEGEPIIPEDPSSTYYLSAKVNILSWKVVSQKVDL